MIKNLEDEKLKQKKEDDELKIFELPFWYNLCSRIRIVLMAIRDFFYNHCVKAKVYIGYNADKETTAATDLCVVSGILYHTTIVNNWDEFVDFVSKYRHVNPANLLLFRIWKASFKNEDNGEKAPAIYTIAEADTRYNDNIESLSMSKIHIGYINKPLEYLKGFKDAKHNYTSIR